jgi:hypothetical protein
LLRVGDAQLVHEFLLSNRFGLGEVHVFIRAKLDFLKFLQRAQILVEYFEKPVEIDDNISLATWTFQ